MKITKRFAIVLAILGAVVGVQIAHAKTIAVNSNADSGPGSLRAALTTAAPGDKINVVVNGTITLTSGELLVNRNLIISGPGSHGSISGNNTSRVFHVTPGTTVTLDSLTITNGAASIELGNFPDNAGGGIYSDHANLTLRNCVVTNSVARFGAGIFSSSKDGGSANLTISNSTISNNSARDVIGYMGAYGGGIFSGGGFVNILNPTSGTATLTITNSTISGNSAETDGGGIFNDGFAGVATLTVSNTIISNNSASDNFNDYAQGGGIYNNGDSGFATVTLTNSTVDHNSAFIFGGAIYNSASVPKGILIFGPVTGESVGGSAVDYQVNFTAGQEYEIYEVRDFDNPDENFDAIIAVIDPNGQTILDQDTFAEDEDVFFVAPVTGQYTVRVHPFFIDGVPTFGHFTLQIHALPQSSLGTANVTVNKCTLSNNLSGSGGGGVIYSYSFSGSVAVTFTNSALTSNQGDNGGAIAFQNDDVAKLTLNSCVLNNNLAYLYGGAIWLQDTDAVVTNTRISQNSAVIGGGVAIDYDIGSDSSSRVGFSDCVIDSNSASDSGGAVASTATELDFLNCTISNNSASLGGGILNEPQAANPMLKLENSTLSGNSAAPEAFGNGGAIFNVAALLPTTVIISNCTLSNNSAFAAGAILSEAFGFSGRRGSATVQITNSTLNGNSGDFGGGIFSWAEDENGSAAIDLANSIINAGSSGDNFVAYQRGEIISHGHNLSSDAAGGNGGKGPGGLLNGPGDIRNTNPLLGPLKDNGGPTLTHALLDHSPAINAGDPNFNPYLFNPPLLYDQRGPNNPRIFKGRVDIGAYEKH